MVSAPRRFAKFFIIVFLICTVLVSSAMMIFAAVGGMRIFTKDEGTPVLEEEMDVLIDSDGVLFDTFKDSKRVNVLLMGVNSKLTDTIMLVSFDPEAKHVDLISIPRDTYYERDGYNSEAERKINAAYQGDPVNTAEAVHEVLLGIPINYYAVIEYDGVAEIVDTMGGVTVDIPFDMNYEDPYDDPPLKIHLSEGEHTLNGEEAVQFLRYRKGYIDGDSGRIKAQQEFMKSAFAQAIGFDLPKVAKSVIKNVESDLPLSKILYLASQAIGIEEGSITTWTMPGDYLEEAPYYVYPKDTEIEEMIKDVYNLNPPDETTSGSISEGAISE